MVDRKPFIVIKIGGSAAGMKSLTSLAREMNELSKRFHFIFIHGGGVEVSRISKLFDLEPRFVDGIRMTTEKEMEVVDMVLAGKMNKNITRLFRKEGLNALGISGSDGGLFTGKAIEESNHTGKVSNVNTGLLNLLCDNEYIPVICSTSMEEEGKALNINADEAALAISATLPADSLIFISDIPGILKPSGKNKELTPLSVLDSGGIRQEIENGVISGGMIPKAESSLAALKKGVKEVIIGDYLGSGCLHSLLHGKKGTKIILKSEKEGNQ